MDSHHLSVSREMEVLEIRHKSPENGINVPPAQAYTHLWNIKDTEHTPQPTHGDANAATSTQANNKIRKKKWIEQIPSQTIWDMNNA